MKIAIIAAGTARNADLEAYKLRPEFRKATLNMILSAASQDEAFAPLTPFVSEELFNASAIVLGSSYGELGTTISFLDFLSQSGVARPLLFQNSLHNSTLGFLAMRLKIKGPAITLSNCDRTGEDCLELATILLEDKSLPFCVVTTVDSIVTQLKIDGEDNIGSKGEGAGTLVMADKRKAEEMGWPVIACLKGLSRTQPNMPLRHGTERLASAYHSDVVEQLAIALHSGSKPEFICFRKSDGQQTLVELEWASC